MSQELIYTSAPQGLKPGSRGFCTVASTQGMAVNLAERLESLSGYRHVFAPADPQEALNPVVFSHLKIAIGGRAHHVLSRICAAGLDYSQRTNKFAHHVVLDPVELPAGGPAWLLSQPSFMETAWSGNPRILPVGRRPPSGSVNPSICHGWQQLTGDAGWGGMLAATAVGGNRTGAMIIFRPGMNMLPLVAEALALLPIPARWETTFSTYYTKLPPGIECKWRFVVEGSPEAAARLPGMLVIDLLRPVPRAPDTPWSQAARTGIPPQIAPSTATNLPAAHPAAQAAPLLIAEMVEISRAPTASVLPSAAVEGYGMGPPPVPQSSTGASWRPERRRFKRKRGSRAIWLLATIGLTLIGGLGVGAIFWKDINEVVAVIRTPNGSKQVEVTKNIPKAEEGVAGDSKETKDEEKSKASAPESETKEVKQQPSGDEASSTDDDAEKRASNSGTSSGSSPMSITPPAAMPMSGEQKPSNDELSTTHKRPPETRNGTSSTEEPPTTNGASATSSDSNKDTSPFVNFPIDKPFVLPVYTKNQVPDEVELPIYCNPDSLRLDLVGLPTPEWTSEREDHMSDLTIVWRGAKIGRFWYKNDSLHFIWLEDAKHPPNPNRLRNAILKIDLRSGDCHKVAFLQLRERIKRPQLTFHQKVRNVDIKDVPTDIKLNISTVGGNKQGGNNNIVLIHGTYEYDEIDADERGEKSIKREKSFTLNCKGYYDIEKQEIAIQPGSLTLTNEDNFRKLAVEAKLISQLNNLLKNPLGVPDKRKLDDNYAGIFSERITNHVQAIEKGTNATDQDRKMKSRPYRNMQAEIQSLRDKLRSIEINQRFDYQLRFRAGDFPEDVYIDLVVSDPASNN